MQKTNCRCVFHIKLEYRGDKIWESFIQWIHILRAPGYQNSTYVLISSSLLLFLILTYLQLNAKQTTYNCEQLQLLFQVSQVFGSSDFV